MKPQPDLDAPYAYRFGRRTFASKPKRARIELGDLSPAEIDRRYHAALAEVRAQRARESTVPSTPVEE